MDSKKENYKTQILEALKDESVGINCTFSSSDNMSFKKTPQIQVEGMTELLGFPVCEAQAKELKEVNIINCV